jgi:hypothetical protein
MYSVKPMRENERQIFEEFLKARPDFAGGPFTWEPGNDPPDVLCSLGTLRVGVELAEWVDEWQIKNGKAEERERDSFEPAIRVKERAPLQNIGEIMMVVKAPLPKPEVARFREQFLAFLAKLDADWLNLEDSDDPQGLDIETFAGFPLLERYVAGLECYPASVRPARSGTQWVDLPGSAAAFDPAEAVESLMSIFRKKIAKYGGLRAGQRLDQLYLLLFYNQAWSYNTPFEGEDYGFANVAQELRTAAASEHGEFDKIFLFDPVATSSVEQVWP